MKNNSQKELIVVRSLTESDLGLFAAHQASARSNQRAININSKVAQQLLSPSLIEEKSGLFDCTCIFGNIRIREPRIINKSKRNWRLGGKKIKGEVFAQLDCKDFILIRSVMANDGTHPITITFICRATDRVVHAGLVAIVEKVLVRSMAVYSAGDSGFNDLARFCPVATLSKHSSIKSLKNEDIKTSVLPMPRDKEQNGTARQRTIQEKMRTPHILERMLSVAGDLSAPAQLRFMKTVEDLADQLRALLLETGKIVKIEKDHAGLWRSVAGQAIGFVDGGLANLSMLGSAPIAARVGGYVVTPGDRSATREQFTMLKHLIDELYAHENGGVYNDTYPDISALRDAARISIEAAGAVRMVSEQPDIAWVMVHGALVNPVSRYTDVMRDGKIRHRFPDFSETALNTFLPPEVPRRTGRNRNFISVYQRQLEILSQSSSIICGVVERESTTSSVCRALLDSFDDDIIRDLLPDTPTEWKKWFRRAIDPSDDDEFEGQRITDSLLFRCVLEPGEALVPVPLDRNDKRRAPKAWENVIVTYPQPQVSYLQATEWSAPIRVEIFEKDLLHFNQTAALIMHCALLLPRYAFPVGLDIVDKFVHIPNWMSRPINTHTAVQALKQSLDNGDSRLFDSLRRMLCGAGREWFLRPGVNN